MTPDPTTSSAKEQSHPPVNSEVSQVRKRLASESQGRIFQATKSAFLERFFHGYDNHSITTAELTKCMETLDKTCHKATEVYDPIVKLFNKVCNASNLRFYNVHRGSDQKASSLNRPDFFAVDTERVLGSKCCGPGEEGRRIQNVCWLHAELVGNFRLMKDEDPFDDRVNLTGRQKKALNQLLHHLFDMSQTQHRTSAFVVVIFKGSARLLRWSPKSVIYTDSFDFKDKNNAEQFLQFLKTFSTSTQAERGINQHFTLAPEVDRELARDFFKKQALKIEAAGFDDPTQSSENYWEITIPLPPTCETGYRNLTIPSAPPAGLPIRKVTAIRLHRYSGSLCGRNARFFAGWDRDLDELVFVKASWTYTGNGCLPESAIYQELEKHKADHAQKMLYGGPAAGREYSTSNWDCDELPSEKLNGHAQTDVQLLNQQFHLMALPFVRPLSTFKNGYELLVGILGALQGIVELNRAGILHRDISTGNVVFTSSNQIEEVEAVIQDFDFAIKVQREGDASRERTGTWMFISAMMIDGEQSHTLADDFESIYHMLCILTYAHITEAVIPQLDSQIKEYLSSMSAPSKRSDITGQASGFRLGEILQIDIFGPIIILFRLFLSTRYLDNPDQKIRRYNRAKTYCALLNLSDIDSLLTPFLQQPTDEEKAVEIALWESGEDIKISFDGEEACQCLINVIKAVLLHSPHVDALKRMNHLRPDFILQYIGAKPEETILSSLSNVSNVSNISNISNNSNVSNNKRTASQQGGSLSKVQRTATNTSPSSKPDSQSSATIPEALV